MGIGSSFGFVGVLKIIINNFMVNEFAFMLGLSESISMAGVTLGIVLLAYCLKLYSWRTTMFMCGIFSLVLFFAIIFFLHEKPTKAREHANPSLLEILAQVRMLITNKQVVLSSMYGFFMFSIVNAFTSLWGVSFITNTYNFSNELASSMVSVVFIGIAIGGPLNGILSKRLNNHTKIMIWGALLAMLSMILIILVPGIPKYLLFIVLFLSGAFCSIYVQALTVVKDSIHPGIQATALATSNTIIMASAPLLQVFIGGLLQSNFFGIAATNMLNYRLSLAILPLGLLCAFVLSIFIQEPKKYVVVHNI